MPIFDDAPGYVPEHTGEPEEPKKEKRGFASMSPEKRREIARKGGIAAHVKGTGHEWTPGKDGTAAKAGREGGRISRGGRGKLNLPEAQKPAWAPGEE